MQDVDQKIVESWELNAEAWAESIREARIASRNLVTNQAIVNMVKARQPARVLDAGCGEGWLVRALAAEGIEITGFDGSASLIEAAKKVQPGRFQVLSYGEFVKGPEQMGHDFDVVVFNFALLSSEIEHILRAAASILHEEGVIIIQTLHPFHIPEGKSYAAGWCEEHFKGMGEGYRASMPWYYRTFSDWLRVAQEAGLNTDKIEEPLHPETGRPASLILQLKH